jgi:hypothetical protein
MRRVWKAPCGRGIIATTGDRATHQMNMLKPELHKTRLDMVSYLQDKMRSGYERYVDEQKLEWEGGLLKTYLVEADVLQGSRDSHYQILSFLRTQSQRFGYFAEELDEENFFALVVRSHVARQAKFDVYYVDASDYRFWVLYTVAHSNRTDHFVAKLVTNSTKLDSAWFPMQFLSDVAKTKGFFLGLGGRFNNTPFVKEEDDQLRISMKLWGNLAADVFEAFRNSTRLRKMFCLSGVRIKRYLRSEESITDDISYFGKITSIGQSFASHADLVATVYKREYRAKIVEVIEKELAIGAMPDQGIASLKGEPIFLTFGRSIVDLAAFTKALFSGTSPFRLWGLQEMVGNDFARVYAVDLHLGRPLSFEIFPDAIRIFLPVGTCGNSVARFFTLFQHHYDSSAELSGGEYEHLF